MQARSIILLLIPLLPFTLGLGYGSAPNPTSSSAAAPPATSSSSSPGSVQTVNVGQNGLVFTPNSISAAVGSMVEFHFFPPTHSVAQSSFSSPCAPLNNGTGFFSGLIQSSGGQNSNVFRITINDTNPIWLYCAFPTHCETGMVGVINPPNDPNQTLDLYTAAAAKVASTVAPPNVQGGVIGPAISSTPSGAAASSTAKPSGAEGSLGLSQISWAGVVSAAVIGFVVSFLMA